MAVGRIDENLFDVLHLTFVFAQADGHSEFLFSFPEFCCFLAAECDFDPELQGLTPQEIRRLDRAAQFALVCVRDAVEDSGVTGLVAPERIGISLVAERRAMAQE